MNRAVAVITVRPSASSIVDLRSNFRPSRDRTARAGCTGCRVMLAQDSRARDGASRRARRPNTARSRIGRQSRSLPRRRVQCRVPQRDAGRTGGVRRRRLRHAVPRGNVHSGSLVQSRPPRLLIKCRVARCRVPGCGPAKTPWRTASFTPTLGVGAGLGSG